MKKRRIIVTSLAVILAVTLAFGGTIAYLTGSSSEVKNKFNKNQNGVELDETTGSEYEIVPGTSQDKDPTITATYTLDSYVFVEVTDATEDLVTWYIANGWKLLSTANNADGSTTYVYYMLLETEDASGWTEVTSSNASSYEDGDNHIGEYVYVDSDGVTYYYDSNDDEYTAIIHVLEGDKVYYDSSITNADIDSAGAISLTFEAHIMQAEPFLGGNSNDVALGAESAYLALLNDSTAYAAAGYAAMVNGKLYTDLSTAMSAALSAGTATTVDVVADSEISDTLLLTVSTGETANITLNLNGNSITYDSTAASTTTTTYSSLIRVGEGVTLTITGDGTIDGTGMVADAELIWARGGTVIIESGTFVAQTANEAVVYASTPNGSTSVGTVEIYGGTFQNTASGSYAYGSALSPLTLNVWNGEKDSNKTPTGYNDSGVSSGDITVYGGTFYGNSPASGDDNLSTQTASDTQRAVKTFVADGYSVQEVTTSSGTAYVVYKSGEAVTISGLSVSNALTALDNMTTGAVTIEASEDSSVSASALQSAVASNDVTIDLNETTLTVTDDSGSVILNNGADLTISNGTVTANNSTSATGAAFNIQSGSSITLENVTMTGDGSVLYPQGNAAEVNIINSTITTSGAYCVATNAATSDNYNVVINIENSTLTASSTDGDNCAVLVNVPCTLNITDSTITGDRQGVIVRGGTAVITNTKITTTGKFVTSDSNTNTTRLNGTWSSGNEVPSAALEVGNYSSSYPYVTDVTLSGVTLTVQSNNDVIPAIYAASYSYNTTLTGASDSDTVLARVSTGTVTINGTSVSTIETMTTVGNLSTSSTN